MKRIPRKLWLILGIPALLALVAVAALPLLVDPNRYRGLIETRAQENLGRDVRLGEIHLSLWPVLGVRVDDVTIAALPEEGGGELLTAERLRVGARLLPLLQKRLEVSSIVIDRPRMLLVRGPDGKWNVERLVAPRPGAAATAEASGTLQFRLNALRISGGRIMVRDAGPGRTRPLELALADLDLRLEDLTPDRPFDLTVSAVIEGVRGSQLRFDGRAGPLASNQDDPATVAGEIEAAQVDAAQLGELLDGVVSFPPGMLGSRPFSLNARVEGAWGPSARLALSDVVLRDLDLGLVRDRDGRWQLPTRVHPAPSSSRQPGPELSLAGIEVSGATLRIRDESATSPFELSLDKLDLSLDGLPTQGQTPVELSCAVESGGERGTLGIQGRIGPRAESGGLRAQLALDLRSIPPALLRLALGKMPNLDLGSSKTALTAELAGELPDRIEARGVLSLSGAKAELTAPDGSLKRVAADLDARYDLVAKDGGANLEVRSLELSLAGNKLALRGSVRREEARHRLDLELLPASIPADDLALLLALTVGDWPVSFASQSPVELRARVRGLYGRGSAPEIEASARLRDFSFRHPSMGQPLEHVSADVSVHGQQVDVRSLRGVIGSSDLDGELSLSGFERPRIRLDLHSRRADFGELFSFLRSDEQKASAARPGDPLGEMSLAGRIRIDAGSFHTLDFSGLDAALKYAGSVLTLSPVTAKLYDGSFSGRVTSDFRGAVPVFEIQGDAGRVDSQAYLADNLQSPDLLSGRLSGKFATAGAGLDYETIVRALSGTGSMQVVQGKVGRLDVLETVAKVSGVFGETTLRRLSKKMATEGTSFDQLSSGLQLDGGRLAFHDLLLSSPEFKLGGQGSINLLTSNMQGQFRLILSPEISQTMRSEGSHAGELFWNARTGQVELPFTLSGPFSEPTAGVDFKSVAGEAAKERAKQGIRDILGDKLGVKPKPAPEPGSPPPDSGAAPGPPAVTSTKVSAEIRGVRWGGSLLARDLKLDGEIRGAGIESASLTVIDSQGGKIHSVERLPEVEVYRASTADRSEPAAIAWKATIDGKKLLLAKFPLTARLVVSGSEGENVVAERRVDR